MERRLEDGISRCRPLRHSIQASSTIDLALIGRNSDSSTPSASGMRGPDSRLGCHIQRDDWVSTPALRLRILIFCGRVHREKPQ